MVRIRMFIAAVCFLPLAVIGAAAQPGLTIDQAVQEAIEHNLSVAAERFNLAVADSRILTAGLRPNPVFTANAMLPDRTIFDGNINPKESVFRGDVLIESGGKRARRVEVARESKAVTELQLRNTTRTLTLDVQSAFIDVQLAQSNVTLARESLASFNDIVNINVERVRTGDLASVELARSRLSALQFQNEVKSRETRLAVATNRLRALLGRSDQAPIDIVGEPRRDSGVVTLDALQGQALDLRPDLRALKQDQARSAAEVRLQLAQGKIDYTVSGEFHRQIAPNAVSGNEWGLFFSAPIPIFNRNQGEIERARQEERQGSARIRALQSDITSEVRSTWQLYSTARELVDTIEQQMLAQARDVRETTAYSYRRGEASFIELLDAQRTFNDTMQSYNEARAEYARSLYALDALTGGMKP